MSTLRLRVPTMLALAASVVACTVDSAESPFPRVASSMGCLVERVTEGAFGQYQFQGVSPDGRWLSYNISETDSGPYQSVLLNLRTGMTETLGASFNNTGNFSSDGRTLIAAVFLADGTTEIVELDLASRSTEVIASDPAFDWLPSYSPNQESIVFNSFRTGAGDLYLYDRRTRNLTQLTNHPGYEAHAEFSPDGTRIMFHRMIGRRSDGRFVFDIYSHDLRTGVETRLTTKPFEESYGSWSPAGTHFVFSSDFEENAEKHNLYVKSIASDELVRLTDGDWKDSYAFWTRDGKFIYFNSDRSGLSQIYRISMDGLGCRRAD